MFQNQCKKNVLFPNVDMVTMCFRTRSGTSWWTLTSQRSAYCPRCSTTTGLTTRLMWWDGLVFCCINLYVHNWCNDNSFVRPSEMTFGLTKGEKLCDLIMHKVIYTNQKTDCFVYPWQHAIKMFDKMRFHVFVRASDVISSFLSMRLLYVTVKSVLILFL